MNKFQEFIKHSQAVRLSTRDREDLRRTLQEYMVQNPLEEVRQQSFFDRIEQRSIEMLGTSRLFFQKNLMPVMISLLIALLAGGGVSYAAEQALPGEPLYAVKVHVNEEVRATLSPSQASRGLWEAERLNRRLQEAEVLAQKNSLTPSVKAELEGEIRAQNNKVRTIIDELSATSEDQNAGEVSANLIAPLKVHSRILAILAAKKEKNGKKEKEPSKAHKEQATDIRELATMVSAERESAAKLQVDSEVKQRSAETLMRRGDAAAQGKLTASIKVLAEASRSLDQVKESLDPSVVAEATAQLEAATKLQAEGRAALEAHAPEKAFGNFQEALRTAQEVKILIHSASRLRLPAGPLKFELDIKNDAQSRGKVSGNEKGEPSDTSTEAKGRSKSDASFQGEETSKQEESSHKPYGAPSIKGEEKLKTEGTEKLNLFR